MRLILIILILGLTINAFCQSTQTGKYIVGKGIDRVIPSEKKYLQFTEKKDGLINFQSILTRKIEQINYKGEQQLLIVQTYQSNKSIDRDSSICNANTLMPLAYFTDIPSEGHKETVVFSETTIENTVFFKDSITQTKKENKGFYNSVIADNIIATMPLKHNAKFSVKMVNPGLRYFEYTAEVEVLGQEDLEIAGMGIIPCWKIKTSARAGSFALEWYSVKGQIQVKKRFEFKDGSVFYRILLVGA